MGQWGRKGKRQVVESELEDNNRVQEGREGVREEEGEREGGEEEGGCRRERRRGKGGKR